MKINSVITEINIVINDVERNALIRLLSNDKIKGWDFFDRQILEEINKKLKSTLEVANESK